MKDVIIHLIFLLLLPPFWLGVINKTKAFVAGRTGASLWQPYFDLLRLMRKGMVLSRTTTAVFVLGPVIALVAVLFAGMLVPAGAARAPLSFAGDFVLVAYLLALGRFFTTAAALDTGSPFEGMGAAREATFACLAEPALFFIFMALARLSGSLNLAGMLEAAPFAAGASAGAPLVLLAFALFVIILLENCRIPFDDPNTHLELTMIHEVMVLDHSGPLFGVILYGAVLKLYITGSILIRLLLPLPESGGGLNWGLFLGAWLGLAVLLGLVESVMARLRLVNVMRALTAVCILSGLGYILLLS